MRKRQFLKQVGLLGTASLMGGIDLAVTAPKKSPVAAFALPSLPYGYEALEPSIDKLTMQVHHDKHHQAYTDKLNAAIAGTKYEGMRIEHILKTISANESEIRNHGGGYYNHALFWKWLTPNGGGKPSGKLADAIAAQFGSFEAFQEKFGEAAAKRFGSGWAWLVADAKGKLFITSTPNQDNPLMGFAEAQGTPILGLDVWEHAYYLKYQNKRADYIAAFWQVVNWPEAARQYSTVR